MSDATIAYKNYIVCLKVGVVYGWLGLIVIALLFVNFYSVELFKVDNRGIVIQVLAGSALILAVLSG